MGEAKAQATVNEEGRRLVDIIVTAWLRWTTKWTKDSQTEALSPQLTFKSELKQASNAWASGLTKMRPSAENLRHCSQPVA